MHARRGLGALSASIALGVAAVILGGCGTEGLVEADSSSRGQDLFTAQPAPDKPSCASCHTLAAAGAQGRTGPNLDDAFRAVREQGFDESTIRQVIHDQILYPVPPMPAELYTGEDADVLAAYIASVAGKPVEETPGASAAPVGPSATGGGGTTGAGGTTGGGTTGGGTTGGGTTGGGDAPSAAGKGKDIFSKSCAACHALAAADASGTVGPDLDESDLSLDAIRQQVANGGSGMPPFKGQLSDAEIDAVSSFVASSRKK